MGARKTGSISSVWVCLLFVAELSVMFNVRLVKGSGTILRGRSMYVR